MQLKHLDGLRQMFVEAVLALSDDPRSENVERYLAASRALEDSRSKSKPRARRAA
jgi:hypothetical protein